MNAAGDPQSPSDKAADIGLHVADYITTGILGHGAMGTVYRARDAGGHEVALKLLREGPGVPRRALERFRREAEVSKILRRHPYILTVHATGQDQGLHYIAMELVREGRTFDDFVQTGRRDRDAILRMGIKLASALEYAHEHGVVHRDIKPANILVDEFGDPLLADFGVAELEDWPRCTESGALTGTPMYMAPEQARAERALPVSDIYSLAVTLYEALCGQMPYEFEGGKGATDVLDAVRTQRPMKLREHGPGFSRDLEYVLARGMAPEQRERYPTARQFGRDLESVLEGTPLAARFVSPLARLIRGIRRYSGWLLGLLALLVAAGIFSVYLLQRFENIHIQQMINTALQRNAVLTENLQQRSQETFHRARVQAGLGQWQMAVEGFSRAADMTRFSEGNRHASLIQLEQARALLMLDRQPEAESIYRSILDASDSSSVAQVQGLIELLIATAYHPDLEPAEKEAAAEQIYQEYQDLLQDEASIDTAQFVLGWKSRDSVDPLDRRPDLRSYALITDLLHRATDSPEFDAIAEAKEMIAENKASEKTWPTVWCLKMIRLQQERHEP